MSTIKALAGATVELNSIPRAPFNYNYRETIKRKPTLLELSLSKSNSLERSTSPTNSRKSSSPITQYRRSRGNARFYSSPAQGSSTLPRSHHHNGPSSISTPSPGLRSRSPSLQEPNSKSGSQIFQDYQMNSKIRKNTATSPKFPRSTRIVVPNHGANELPIVKHPRHLSSIDDEPLRFFPSPDARESPDGEHAQIHAETNASDTAGTETHLRKTKQDMFETLGPSCDSGICSKSDDLMKDVDSDSTLGDDVSLNRLIVRHGYESGDSPSTSEFDLYTPWSTQDSVRSASAVSLNMDSPVRRVFSDEGPRPPAGLLREPKSNTLGDRRRPKGHSRNISTGIRLICGRYIPLKYRITLGLGNKCGLS